jgi:8-oxo-dGTP diphosphatase
VDRKQAREFAARVVRNWCAGDEEIDQHVQGILSGSADNLLGIGSFPEKEHPRNPYLTVDAIIEIPMLYKNDESGMGIVVIERKNPPHGFALPGGFVEYGESVEDAIKRECKEETGLDVIVYKQFHVYSKPNRDPRQHNVSVVFLCRADALPAAGDDAAKVDLVPFKKVLDLKFAFDHKQILTDFLEMRYG